MAARSTRTSGRSWLLSGRSTRWWCVNRAVPKRQLGSGQSMRAHPRNAICCVAGKARCERHRDRPSWQPRRWPWPGAETGPRPCPDCTCGSRRLQAPRAAVAPVPELHLPERLRQSRPRSRTCTARRTRSTVLVVRSMAPATGLATKPKRPRPTPLKKPAAPSCLAPRKGSRNTPVAPSKTPLMKDSPPCESCCSRVLFRAAACLRRR